MEAPLREDEMYVILWYEGKRSHGDVYIWQKSNDYLELWDTVQACIQEGGATHWDQGIFYPAYWQFYSEIRRDILHMYILRVQRLDIPRHKVYIERAKFDQLLEKYL